MFCIIKQGGTTMYNTRENNLAIAKRYVDGEISSLEAAKLLGGARDTIYYWAKEYKRSIGDTSVPPKSYKAKETKTTSIKDEVANEDEISRLSSLTKEELIDEVIKAKVGEARAKKGYEVKGGGANQEYVILSNKNTK